MLNILLVLQLIVLILLSVSTNCIAQSKFNKVINPEHPSMNILVSTTPIDDGYILVIGSRYVEVFGNNRCSMVLKTDNFGNVIYRNFVCDSIVDVYEGWFDQKTIATNYGTYKYVFHKEWLCSYICEFDGQLNLIDSKSIYFSNDSSLVNVKMTGFSNIDDCLYIPNIAKIDTLGTELYHPVIYKLDSNNNLIYKKGLYIGSYKHQYTSIIKAHDDNLIAFGEMKSIPVWLVSKIDTAGNMIWYHTYGRANWNNGLYKFIAPSPDNCYVMSGVYPVCYANSYHDDYWYATCIRKIDDNGNLLWEKIIKNYSPAPLFYLTDEGYDLYVDDNGYIYVASTIMYNNFSGTGALTKLSPQGDIMYIRHYEPTGRGEHQSAITYLNSVKPTPDGGLIMGGYTYDRYYTAAEFGDYFQQPWLVKTDMDGLDGLCYTELPELDFDIFIPDTVCNLDTIDCVVNISGPSAPYRLDFSTGQVIDSIYYPDTYVPYDFGIDRPISSEYLYEYSDYITEATLKKNTTWEDIIAKHYNIRTPRDPGEHQLAITLSDYYGNIKTIYKDIYVNPCHDLAVDENDNIMLSIYPNPATEYINIAGENIVEIEICNLLGEVVYYNGSVVPRRDATIVISTEGMSAGSYFVRVRMVNGKVVTKKIIVL